MKRHYSYNTTNGQHTCIQCREKFTTREEVIAHFRPQGRCK